MYVRLTDKQVVADIIGGYIPVQKKCEACFNYLVEPVEPFYLKDGAMVYGTCPHCGGVTRLIERSSQSLTNGL